MNWYIDLKEAEKTASMWDALRGTMRNRNPIVPVNKAPQRQNATSYALEVRKLREELDQVQMSINQLKNQLRTNPSARGALDAAMKQQQQILGQIANLHDTAA